MKKGIVVLLITVLVAGFAFAGKFNGSAGIEFGVDFDGQTWGFENSVTGKYTFSFEFDTTSVALGDEHQTDVWAELAAEASAYIALSKASISASGSDISPEFEAEITTANIHIGEDLTIGILSAGSTKNFAQHYTILSSGSAKYNSLAKVSGIADGFTVTYKDWTGGFGATGSWADSTAYTIFAHALSPDFLFGEEDEIALKAGAYAVIKEDGGSYFGAGFFSAYSVDKFDVDLEGDFKVADGSFNYELTLNSNINVVENLPIAVNAYATQGALVDSSTYTGDYAESMKLDAKVGTSYSLTLDEEAGTALDLEGSVEVEDALINALALTISASEETTISNVNVKLEEELGLGNLANDSAVAATLGLGVYAGYTADKYTLYGDADLAFDFSAEKALSSFAFEAGIESSAFIEGADLALIYANSDFVAENKGTITASCTISF